MTVWVSQEPPLVSLPRRPPYRETRNYVDRIRSATMSGRAAPAPFRLYRMVQIVEGREVVKYSNVAAPGAQLISSASRR